MTRRWIGISGLLALALLAGCPAKRVPNALEGQSRYTCCNIRYEKDEINDANYQVGTIIPFGTRVQILEVGGDRVKFQAEGAPPITWFRRFGKDVPMETYLSRLFLETDPKTKLSPKMPAKTRKLLEQGVVEPGMTRDQVLLSLGYPPAHRTPSLAVNSWHYWRNRFVQFDVYFDGDKVDRVQ
jgi:SmpA / OmlA family